MIELKIQMKFLETLGLDRRKFFVVRPEYGDGETWEVYLQIAERRNEKKKWLVRRKQENQMTESLGGIYLDIDELVSFMEKKQLNIRSFHAQVDSKFLIMLHYASIIHKEAEKLEEGIVERAEEQFETFADNLRSIVEKQTKGLREVKND